MVSQDFIERFAIAIAHEEGFYVNGSIPQRSKNPGDLTDDGNIGNGVIETDGPDGAKITIYSSIVDGWNALYRKLRRMFAGASEVYLLSMSLTQVGMEWSGTSTWGSNVAAELGVSSDTTLAELAAADLQSQGTEIT